jgi:ABC-type spermidine/putrescine transport system permease subunit II
MGGAGHCARSWRVRWIPQGAFDCAVGGTASGDRHRAALFDPAIEEAAVTLGASRWRAFRAATLPAILPGLVSGGFLAFLASFDDVPVALFMGGGENSTTFPLQVLASLEFSLKPDIMAMSTLVIVASVLLVLVLDRCVGLERVLGGVPARQGGTP